MLGNGRIALAAIFLAAPAQAHATDWWLVSGEPGGNAAIFVDADTVVRHRGSVTFRMERIERHGPEVETIERLHCDGPPASAEEEAVLDFACSTEGERMNSAMIVSPMTPRETARLIFAMPRQIAGTSAPDQ